MATHTESAMKLLRSIDTPAEAVKATMALAHAQLATVEAVRAHTVKVEALWKAQLAQAEKLWHELP